MLLDLKRKEGMLMVNEIKLDGVAIKKPSSFKIERYSITKAERVSSGLMQMDLIAKKRKFFLEWAAINSAEINVILNIIWEGNNLFFPFSYVENNEVKTAEVYVGAIPTDLYRTDEANWIWTDVKINFIER